ncbi:MAG: MFS transporter [Armatimonadetes bacterium]|nr:MFS transporter [Armatimonadota bacterium]
MKASRLYLLARAAQGFAFALFWTITLYFQDTVVHLDAFQLVLLGSVAEVTIFCFEIPTGVVADLVSRKLSVVLGFLIVGAGFVIQPIGATWPILVIGMIGWGLGETFLSGAFEAWITDELPFEDNPPTATEIFLRASQANIAGYLVGIWVSIVLATINLRLPLIVSGCAFLLIGVVLAVVMTEKGFHRAADQERMTWARFRQTLTTGLIIAHSKPLLLDALWVVFFIGLASEALDRLWNKHVTSFGLPKFAGMNELYWFAIIASGGMLSALLLTTFIRHKGLETDGGKVIKLITVLLAGLILITLIFGLAGNFYVAAAGIIGARMIRRTIEPLTTAWVNDHAEPEVRATMLSIKGQAHGLGETLGGPLLGAVAKLTTVSAALVGSAICNIPALLASLRGTRRRG